MFINILKICAVHNAYEIPVGKPAYVFNCLKYSGNYVYQFHYQ